MCVCVISDGNMSDYASDVSMDDEKDNEHALLDVDKLKYLQRIEEGQNNRICANNYPHYYEFILKNTEKYWYVNPASTTDKKEEEKEEEKEKNEGKGKEEHEGKETVARQDVEEVKQQDGHGTGDGDGDGNGKLKGV